MRPRTSFNTIAACGVTIAVAAGQHHQTPRSDHHASPPMWPSRDSAAANGHRIFNEVHSAGRQWGSSLNHNGLGFVPALIPRGSVFYHGTQHEEIPDGKEWLAFEPEHAEAFARSYWKQDMRRPPRNGIGKDPDEDGDGGGEIARLELRGKQQHSFSFDPCGFDEAGGPNVKGEDGGDGDRNGDGWVRGYLQAYQASRDLHVLYIDGMSAGKTNMGTVDSQDLVLRNLTYQNDHASIMSDWERADEMCALAAEWGLDGVVRMEIGFELIHCDFHIGLDLLWMTRSAIPAKQTSKFIGYGLVQLVRAVGERYDGLGDRLRLDFSSMVSGLFFPMNISTMDPERPDLVRLGSADKEHLVAMREHTREVVTRPRSFTVSWQYLADMIVGRFSERLVVMTSRTIGDMAFISEMEAVTTTYYDEPRSTDDVKPSSVEGDRSRTADAVERCAGQFLHTAVSYRNDWSLEDSLLHAAFETVTRDICNTFFTARQLVIDASSDSKQAASSSLHLLAESDMHSKHVRRAIDQGQYLLTDLVERLSWTGWKKPRRCGVDDSLFVAMWPIGNGVDHWEPGCRTFQQMNNTRSDYWPWTPLR